MQIYKSCRNKCLTIPYSPEKAAQLLQVNEQMDCSRPEQAPPMQNCHPFCMILNTRSPTDI